MSDGAPPAASPAAPTAPPLSAAFMAGWLMAQLHGPIADKEATTTHPLPTVNELGRTDRIKLTLYEIDALLIAIRAWPPAKAGVAYSPDQASARTRLDTLVDAFDKTEFQAAVERFHIPLLTYLTVKDRRLGSSYSLGRSLSDTCFLPIDYESFRSMFSKYRLASLQSWLTGLSADLPQQSSSAVSQGLGNWATWVEVNNNLTWTDDGTRVRAAAREQGERWRGLLAGDRDPDGFLTPEAYVEAGQAALRRAMAIVRRVIVNLWWVLLIILAATVAAVVIAVSYSHGYNKVWGGLVSVLAGFGVTAKSTQSTAKSVGASAEGSLLQIAKADAIGWATTVLPDIPVSKWKGRELRKAGVGPPRRTTKQPAPPPAVARPARPARPGSTVGPGSS
jgi:hypothetical protein